VSDHVIPLAAATTLNNIAVTASTLHNHQCQSP
jgi:hypothetical protein